MTTTLTETNRALMERMYDAAVAGEFDEVIGIIRMPDRRTGEDVLLAEESIIRDGRVVEINVFYNNAQSLISA